MSCKDDCGRFGRRALLGGAAGVGGLLALSPLTRLFASAPVDTRLVYCFFNGGWDVLLGADPRDPSRTYSGIQLGTDLLAPQWRTPVQVNVGGTATLLGAPMASLAAHADVLTLFRGVNMNTVDHGIGQNYMYTCVAPSGNAPRGSTLNTVLASSGPLDSSGPIIPNVAIAIPTYNESYSAEVNALQVSSPSELRVMIGGFNRPFASQVETLLEAAEAEAKPCIANYYRNPSPAEEKRISRERLKKLQKSNIAARFAFDQDTDEMRQIRSLFNLNEHAGMVAATSAQLLRTGVIRAVSATVQFGMDTHFADWITDQPARTKTGSDAIAGLLTWLRQDDPNLEKTIVVVGSDFSRTPMINSARGRDHWFTNSVMVFGGKLRRGVFGATNEENLDLLHVDLQTGAPNPSGAPLQPEHIAATIVASAGLDSSRYRVEPLRSLLV